MLGSALHTYLLAQAFGLYFVIMAIVLLSREGYYRNKLVQEFSYPSLLSCSLSLLLSIILVLLHNIWVLQPRVMVTIICWTFFVRTVLLLAAPERMYEMTKKICAGKGYYAYIAFIAILGVLLMTRGSYLFIFKAGAM